MDVERLARKLEPLMPTEVSRWLRIRDTADPEMRSLIDKQIVQTAHRRLGDFHNKVLLSLPPQRVARGTLHVGTVLYDQEKWPFGLSKTELMQHVAIFGRSGAGKTNLVFHLVKQLIEQGITVVFMDWKRTARHLLPHLRQHVDVYTPGRSLSPFPFNPFMAPPGIPDHVYSNHVVDALAEAYTLGDGAKSLLHRALASGQSRHGHCPTVAEILAEVKSIPDKERVRGWKISAIRALESVESSEMASQSPIKQEEMVRVLIERSAFIELESLSQSARKFLVPLLALWIYQVKLGSASREKLSLVLVIEEAHHVLYRNEQRTKESLLNSLLRQCREIGIGIIVVDQHCHLISSAALGNTFTSICLNQKDPADINRAAGLSLLGSDDRKYLSMLRVGEGIVKMQDRWSKPFLVRFPLIDVQKGWMTDARLLDYLRNRRTGSCVKRPEEWKNGQVQEVRVGDKGLEEGAVAFLQDVMIHRESGVKERYRRLEMSGGRGHRLKASLVQDGWLDEVVVPIGKSRKNVLRLTPAAWRILGDGPSKSIQREGILHEYWKHHYARRFQELGYSVEIEALIGGGRIDVLAKKDGKMLAVEVETGKSNVIRNVKLALSAGIGRILVVATDEKAMKIVERQLGREGLLINGRVEVVLREGGCSRCRDLWT